MSASDYRTMLRAGANLVVKSSEFSAAELRTMGMAARQGGGTLQVIDDGYKSSAELRTIAWSGCTVICDPAYRSPSDIRTIGWSSRQFLQEPSTIGFPSDRTREGRRYKNQLHGGGLPTVSVKMTARQYYYYLTSLVFGGGILFILVALLLHLYLPSQMRVGADFLILMMLVFGFLSFIGGAYMFKEREEAIEKTERAWSKS